MKLMLVLAVFMSSVAFARKGPMPHERVDTPNLKNANAGRYLYLGDVPKFDGKELEITISKMNLTTRVTALVSQERIDSYAQQMFLRWKTINDAFMDRAFSLHPLVKLSSLSQGKSKNIEAWVKIAEQYSSHILEKTDKFIYRDQRNQQSFSGSQEEEQYKSRISEAYFRYLFATQEKSDDIINDNLKLERLLSVSNSRKLFTKHLGHLFTPSNEKSGHVGTLNFVYPISATVAGPFDQPKEMVYDLKTAQSFEARWWSNKWKDEFGGFPFLLIEWSGVAFHGPISNFGPMDVWFLRRGYVSHGCHRMDASDVLEFRALMPFDLPKAVHEIKVVVLDHFDVVDWNKDGVEEVIDVKYYDIPSSVSVGKNKTIEEVIGPYLIENQKTSFIQKNSYASKFYDKATDTLRNIPKYIIGKKSLSRSGVYQEVKIDRFDYRPNRIIQYTEDSYSLRGFDDSFGKYPPKHFQRY